MKIRKLEDTDIDAVIDLWYEASIKAHSFIDAKYWAKNKATMRDEYLPGSETYLAVENGKIVGFIAMCENYLAAVFVSIKEQGRGIGTQLLDFIKDKRTAIELKVYKKNTNTVTFYKKHDFKIASKNIEDATDEIEYLMKWTKE